MGILLSEEGSSRVSVFASPSAAPLFPVFAQHPELANIKPLSHHLYPATPAPVNGKNPDFLLPAFGAKEQQMPQLKYVFEMSHHLASSEFVKFELHGGIVGFRCVADEKWFMYETSGRFLIE